MEFINVVINDYAKKLLKNRDDDDDQALILEMFPPNDECSSYNATPVNSIRFNSIISPYVNESSNASATDPPIHDSKDDNLIISIIIRANVPSAHVIKNHPSGSIIGEIESGITNRKKE